MTKIMTVLEASRVLGVSERWLRDAEKVGKIPRARRNLNNWRVYSEEDISKIKELLLPSRK